MWVETMEGEEARIVKWMADSVGCDTPKLHFGEGFFFFFWLSLSRQPLFFPCLWMVAKSAKAASFQFGNFWLQLESQCQEG